MTAPVTFPEWITALLDARMLRVRVAAPGHIKSYDASKRLADIEVGTNPADPADPSVFVPRGIIRNVPIVFPGGGGYSLTFPLKAGDKVELVFQDHSIDQWKERGTVVDVVDLRNHHDSDAMAFPGLRATPDANLAAHADHLVLGMDDDPAMQVVIDGSLIKLSANATNFVALANLVSNKLGIIKTWAALVETAVNTLAPGSIAGPSSLATTMASTDVAATKVKAE